MVSRAPVTPSPKTACRSKLHQHVALEFPLPAVQHVTEILLGSEGPDKPFLEVGMIHASRLWCSITLSYCPCPDFLFTFREISLETKRINAPTSAELTELAQRIAQRVSRYLERQGLLPRDAQTSYLAGEVIDEVPMDPLWGHSIIWRIAVGPQAGPRAPGGESALGARIAAATRPGAACARLKGFTQRHRINRVYPDAVGSMPGQGIV